MRSIQLEAWVLSIVERVYLKHKVEDSRVELKAKWPADMNKAARQIAGHANASRGEPILWIIGLDEKEGVVPVEPVDFADWTAQLGKHFDGVMPAFRDIVIPTGTGQVTALFADTTRAPYVVRNAAFGLQGGGPVTFEVPWRDGTSVRSARREDLMRLLMPLQDLPSIEVRSARISAGLDGTHWECKFYLTLYITPQTARRVVFPTHKSRLEVRADGVAESLEFDDFLFSNSPFVNELPLFGGMAASHTIQTTSSEAIIDGPGTLFVRGRIRESLGREIAGRRLLFTATLTPAGIDKSVTEVIELSPVQIDGSDKGEWHYIPSNTFQ